MNSERAIIVNENDQVIGFKDKEELEPQDRYRISGVWIENGRGDALIALRSKGLPNHPGVWGSAAGGSLAQGESYDENAYRELAEELGVTGLQLEEVEVGSRKVDGADGAQRFCRWYKAVLDKPVEAFQPEDKIEQLAWVNKAWLLQDSQEHPENYLPSAQHWPELFKD